MGDAIRVLLADDHPVFRKGLKLALEEAPGIAVVAEAENGEVAIARVQECRPDVAVLDLDMPLKDGVAVALAIRDLALPVRVILLTAHKSDALVNQALDSGLHGYMLKDAAVAEIVDCVRQVHAGRRYVSPQLSALLLHRRARIEELHAREPRLEDLSPTERKVLNMVAQGKSSKEIAGLLFISVRTVEHHRASIGTKLNLHGSSALVKFAITHRSELS